MMSLHRWIRAGGLALFLNLIVVAQNSGGVDQMFEQARTLAFAGNREEARQLCARILEISPAYIDARLLIGRTYSWDGNYERAREQFRQVLEAKPEYTDARVAAIDVELWSGFYRRALEYSDEGLNRDPSNELLLYRRARALEHLDEKDAAIETTRRLLAINPNNKDAVALLSRLREANRDYRMKIEYGYDAFDRTFDPWHTGSFSLSKQFSRGSVIGRLNIASRFGATATQYEIDAYPSLRKGTYAYLNAGYSNSTIFPRLRFGGEIYQSLPRAFETSIGARHLRFSSSSVTLYTGSVGKYYGNYWFSFRPFITPSSIGSSFSGSVLVRRYFEDSENYVTLTVGSGSAPDQRYTTADLFRLKSEKVGFDARRRIRYGFTGVASFGFANEELKFGGSRKTYSLGIGIEKRF